MRRWLKILLAVLVALIVLLVLNAIVIDHQTKGAKVTVDGARILHLSGGDLQVLEQGPVASSASRPGATGSAQGSQNPRAAEPIVLLHCYSCSINWWSKEVPLLQRGGHRVIAIDLLGHGGSEMPGSGY